MADNTDVVHVVSVTRSQTGTGDGLSRLFALTGEGQRLTPTQIDAVFLTDWQGSMTQLYSFPRTNLLPFSDSVEGNWQGAYGLDVVQDEPTVEGPSGVAGGVSSIRLGDCTADGSNGGVMASAALAATTTYVYSVWMRAGAPLQAAISLLNPNPGPAMGLVNVTTQWARYWVQATSATAATQVAAALVLSQAVNAGVDPNTKLYFTHSQTEVMHSWMNGIPGRIIPTNGSAQTVQDFRLSDSNILTTVPPVDGAPLFWTGTGYWLETTNTFDFVDVNLLSAVTWRYDESARLLALLRAKQAWFNTNHTEFWKGWTDNIFNLKDAATFGIAIWAFILNVPLSTLSLTDRSRYFAFGPLRENFTDSDEPENPTSGNFPPVNSGGTISTPQEKIQALRLKYYALTTDASITNLNKMLKDVFGDEGLAYVVDNEDMSMEYVFTFPISVGFRESMINYGLLPKPAGVKITITAP